LIGENVYQHHHLEYICSQQLRVGVGIQTVISKGSAAGSAVDGLKRLDIGVI
jgi:hypothetical protein